MKKSKIYKVRPTEIVQELQKREEEKLNELLIMGFDKSEVEKMRFNHQHKLDYPSNPIPTLISNVLSILFSYSDRIHKDVLFEAAKELLKSTPKTSIHWILMFLIISIRQSWR